MSMSCCLVSLLRLRTVLGVAVHDDRGVAVSCAEISWATSDRDGAVRPGENGVLGGRVHGGILKDGSEGGGMGVLGTAGIGVSGGSVLASIAMCMLERGGAMFGSGVAEREFDSILLSTFFYFLFLFANGFFDIFIFFLHLNWGRSKHRGFFDEAQTKFTLPMAMTVEHLMTVAAPKTPSSMSTTPDNERDAPWAPKKFPTNVRRMPACMRALDMNGREPESVEDLPELVLAPNASKGGVDFHAFHACEFPQAEANKIGE